MTTTENAGTQGVKGLVCGLLEGFFLPVKGWGLLWNTPGARRRAFYPLIANLLVYVLVVVIAFWLTGRVNISEVQWDFWWGIGKGLAAAVNFLLPVLKWLVMVPLLLLIIFFTFNFVGMLVAAPFNDLLSETLEDGICGKTWNANAGWRLTVKAFGLSLYSTLRITLTQLVCAVVCVPLLFIPGAGAVIMFLVMAYFTGLGFLDIAMARNYLRYPHKAAVAKEYRWQLIGLGIAMELLLLIPLAGLLILPLGVAGGTLLYCRIGWGDLIKRHGLKNPEGFVPPVVADENRR